jgi:hypothetical protein
MFRKIKRILKPVTKMGLSKIDVPDQSASTAEFGDPSNPKEWKGPWVTLTKPSAIATIVKDINRKQYNQAQETRFGSGYLAETFGRRGDTPSAHQIINGTVPPACNMAPLLSETRRILSTIATPYPSVQDGTGQITQDEFIAAYTAVKESTSSSPSGRHVGHYKAAINDPTLAQLNSQRMSFPSIHGFALTAGNVSQISC